MQVGKENRHILVRPESGCLLNHGFVIRRDNFAPAGLKGSDKPIKVDRRGGTAFQSRVSARLRSPSREKNIRVLWQSRHTGLIDRPTSSNHRKVAWRGRIGADQCRFAIDATNRHGQSGAQPGRLGGNLRDMASDFHSVPKLGQRPSDILKSLIGKQPGVVGLVFQIHQARRADIREVAQGNAREFPTNKILHQQDAMDAGEN